MVEQPAIIKRPLTLLRAREAYAAWFSGSPLSAVFDEV